MQRAIATLCLVGLCGAVRATRVSVPTAAAHTFTIGRGTCLLDGMPFQIIAGEMHYARIPRQYWRHRLRMAKAMGLNTIATYVFWNYHELRPGVFDFHSGNRDLVEFVREAQQEGLWVILRPGPYVCAEWDFGGIPSYLLRSPAVHVRSNDPRYQRAAARYLRALGAQVHPLLVTHGGPILMVQVENEYGSFGADSAYKEATRRMLVDAGIDVPLFTADGDDAIARGGIPGVFASATGEENYDSLAARTAPFNHGMGPNMVAEFYPGWLTHWDEPLPSTPLSGFLSKYDSLLARGASVSLYMFHGGTNFGFTAGANYTKTKPIVPSMTSYDYGAPLSEAGWPTDKYYALRDVIRRHVTYAIPDVPARLPVIAVPAFRLTQTARLFDLVAGATPVHALDPLSFADLDQSQGYVLYRHHVNTAIDGELAVPGLRDFAEVFVNGRRVATLDRGTKRFTAHVTVAAGARLDIFVENMGHINYGPLLVDDRKGIVQPVTLGGARLTGWDMYRLPFDTPSAVTGEHTGAVGPTVYRGSFTIGRTGDTFLDMRGWNRGIVFVNGVNLGRYWRVGPQQTLYLPGAWLRRGRNEIEVFDLEGHIANPSIAGLTTPVLDQLE
ncbi:MAG TPA: beta-galactosidase family protein [Gemmatimonadaceae bacterium]|nr:beta-galactosidase family protein [Gemmatimonadaceae bacterium]